MSECCPKCKGASGYEGQSTERSAVCGAWGGTPEYAEGHWRTYSLMRCIDCGAKFVVHRNPALFGGTP